MRAVLTLEPNQVCPSFGKLQINNWSRTLTDSRTYYTAWQTSCELKLRRNCICGIYDCGPCIFKAYSVHNRRFVGYWKQKLSYTTHVLTWHDMIWYVAIFISCIHSYHITHQITRCAIVEVPACSTVCHVTRGKQRYLGCSQWRSIAEHGDINVPVSWPSRVSKSEFYINTKELWNMFT